MKNVISESGLNNQNFIFSVFYMLQESLILMYSPKTPQVFSVYPPLRQLDPHVSAASGNIAGPTPSADENRLLQQRPTVTPAVITGQLRAKVKQRLEQSIQHAGGVGVFLFLVAKVEFQ